MTGDAPPDALRESALGEEVRTAILLLKHGLRELQGIDATNDFHYLPMLLISQGLERLMKCIVALTYLNAHGAYPGPGHFQKTYGHDLDRLLDQIVSDCYREPYIGLPVAADDHQYLTADGGLRDLLRCLTLFAGAGRYYNLNVVEGACSEGGVSPGDAWRRIETWVAQQTGALDRVAQNLGALNDEYPLIVRPFVVTFERLARALCRLFTLSHIAPHGGRYCGYVQEFLCIRDEELGSRDYSA